MATRRQRRWKPATASILRSLSHCAGSIHHIHVTTSCSSKNDSTTVWTSLYFSGCSCWGAAVRISDRLWRGSCWNERGYHRHDVQRQDVHRASAATAVVLGTGNKPEPLLRGTLRCAPPNVSHFIENGLESLNLWMRPQHVSRRSTALNRALESIEVSCVAVHPTG